MEKERSRGKEWWLVFIGKWVFKCLINLSQKKDKRVDIGEGKRLVRLGHRRRLSALLLGVTKWKKKVQACSYMVRLSELGLRPTMCHKSGLWERVQFS